MCLRILDRLLVTKGLILYILLQLITFSRVLLRSKYVLLPFMVITDYHILLIIMFNLLMFIFEQIGILKVDLIKGITFFVLKIVLLSVYFLVLWSLVVVLHVLFQFLVLSLIVSRWYFTLKMPIQILGGDYDLLVIDILDLLCLVKFI